MIKIKIGTIERTLESIDDCWIRQQIDQRRLDDGSVCVRVDIEKPGLSLLLSSVGCSSAGGGGRSPNPNEKEVLSIWERCGMHNDHFSSENLISFLKTIS